MRLCPFEERRARAKEDGSRFEDGVAAVRRTERASNAVYRMLRVACSPPHAFRSRRRVPDG
jgi:hypothetical protein